MLGGRSAPSSYHVRTLHQLGLIELVDETRVRGAVEHHYKARARPKVTDEAWAQAPPIAKQAAVGSSLQMIDDYAARVGRRRRLRPRRCRTHPPLDDARRQGLAAAREGVSSASFEQAQKIEADATERLGRAPRHEEESIDVGLVTMMFEAIALGEAIDGADGRHRRGSRDPACGDHRPLSAACRARPVVGVPSNGWSTRTNPSPRARTTRTKAARASDRAPRRRRACCCWRSSPRSRPGGGTYIVNHESRTSDHADEAQATARVFLPEYVKARDGLMAMKKRGRAYVYHYDTSIPMPDLKVLAFSGSTAEIGAIAAAQAKLRALWPSGATAPASGAALQRRWKRSPALRRQVADALTSVNAAVGGLTRVAG